MTTLQQTLQWNHYTYQQRNIFNHQISTLLPVEHMGDFFKKKEILDKREKYSSWTSVSLVKKKKRERERENFELDNHL